MSRLLNDLSNLASKNNKGIAHYNLGMTSLNQKNYHSAINSFLKAIKEDPSPTMEAMARPSLGLAYILNKQYEEAIDSLVKAASVKNSPDGKAFIHANLGYAYSELKYYGLAIREYKKSIEFRPDDAKIHYSLAMLYDSKFQSDLAFQELEKALQIEPANRTYLEAKDNLVNTPLLSLTVGRLTHPLPTLGLIAVPVFSLADRRFYPMIVYIYPYSPFARLAKPGDIISWVDGADSGKGFLELLNIAPGMRLSLMINKARTVVTGIPQINSKLSEEEKQKLYYDWFKSFDSRIVNIWTTESTTDRDEAGTKWGYEFESLIRSWSAYRDKDPLFDAAFSLLMEFFQAYTYSGSETNEVHYEINLAKLKFDLINPSIINFFKEINFSETAKYLENLLNKKKLANSNSSTKLVNPANRKVK